MQVFFAGTAPVNAFISMLQPHLSSLRGVPWQDLLFLAVLFISGIAIPTLCLLVTAGRRGLLTLLPVDVILFLSRFMSGLSCRNYHSDGILALLLDCHYVGCLLAWFSALRIIS